MLKLWKQLSFCICLCWVLNQLKKIIHEALTMNDFFIQFI
ncbi:Hypothetical Protein C248_2210 [Staphylococcus aureus 08BA02176]|nr:Hypothetical Protein C248_2210 [Staphylococcus aureus 08BA02176]